MVDHWNDDNDEGTGEERAELHSLDCRMTMLWETAVPCLFLAVHWYTAS